MRSISRKMIFLCGLLVLFGFATSWAQSGIVSIYKVGGLISGTTVRAGENVRFLIRFNNNMSLKCDVSNGFKLSSPDGATWDSTTIDSIGPIERKKATYFWPLFNVTHALRRASFDGQGADTVGILGSGDPTDGEYQMPSGFNDSVFAVTAWFNGKQNAAGKHICIDSSFWRPGGTWVWVDANTVDHYPEFQGLTPLQPYSDGLPDTRLGSGYCFYLYAPMLATSESELTFSAQAGGSNPSSQSFLVSSTGDSQGDHLNFTLYEGASWLSESPTSGTTPRGVTVSANISGLLEGTYMDSIRVAPVGSSTSAVYVKVTLHVTTPPPTISVSRSSFTFLGMVGGTDPTPQSFIIKNTGASVLHWNLSHSRSWLGLDPTSGTDSGLVTVSPSITGLGSGDYYDTIVVSDPNASNNPVKVPVKLSIGSSLPAIEVDSTLFHILGVGPISTITRTLHIRNSGVGTLTYTLTKNGTDILSITPTSGTAPDSARIVFKYGGGNSATEFWDTVWVTSPEATNSPVAVVFHTRFVQTAQFIAVSKDTVTLRTYQCSEGVAVNPIETLLVWNSGEDNPMAAGLQFESDLFTVSPLRTGTPAVIRISALYPTLPLGVYFDTVWVSATWAINTPRPVIIRYERLPETPKEIVLSRDSIVVVHQTGPTAIIAPLGISNSYPGCMAWSADSPVPWFSVTPSSGSAPQTVAGTFDFASLSLGRHRDSFYVSVNGGTNSPKVVRLRADVWRYHGDWDWNGIVNLVDLSSCVLYLTSGAPLPQPEYMVGDLNCSGLIDLTDLTTLVAYLTGESSIRFCGN